MNSVKGLGLPWATLGIDSGIRLTMFAATCYDGHTDVSPVVATAATMATMAAAVCKTITPTIADTAAACCCCCCRDNAALSYFQHLMVLHLGPEKPINPKP